MQDLKFEGVGQINGGEFNTVTIEGVGTCSSKIKAETINIEGVFNCSGDVEVGYLYCGGVAEFKSNIRAKRLVVEGVVSEKNFSKIEAEEIHCKGVIKTGGEISADRIYAEGCIAAKEILGDDVKINAKYHANKIIKLFQRDKSEVDLIEATRIELSGVTAGTVNGKDIIIGPNCRIDKIDCSGTITIDRSSFVRELTGDFTRRDV